MLFFVAKGPADSCGTGCDEWIAAEGKFVPGTAQRFRDFLVTLSERNLPIFFHSRGGIGSDAIQIGYILRERGMTAGVGRTVTEDCRVFSKGDFVCQRLINSGGGVKARLRTRDGQCHSACVFALVGASIRRTSPGAILGVHSARIDVGLKKQIAPDLPQAREITVAGAHRAYRSYLAVMGVEPRLVDIAARVDSRRIYILSGDEIARLGIETRGRYETVWLADKDSSGRPLVMKSITEPMATDGSDYQTSTIRAWCRYKGWILFSYQRRVRPNEDGVLFVVSVTVGSSSNLLQESIAVKVIHASRVFTNLDFFHKAIAAGDFTFVEAFSPRKGPGWSRVVKLSIVGLADALTGWQKSCMES